MQPVRSVKNQYLGINAHLHSFWQGEGKWNRFHNAHITHLRDVLQAHLIPKGYMLEMEEALQIRQVGESSRRLRSDVQLRAQTTASSFTAELTVEELIEEDVEHPYFAIAVYPLLPDLELGDAVAWIELLSPTNKGNTPDANAYLGKRRALIDTGVVFVEPDYLHETQPTFSRLADYTQQEDGSHPYRIVVLDPRPNVRTGPAAVYEFDVDTPIPTVTVPLSGNDKLDFDFGLPYQRMFEQGFYGYRMDYSRLPLNFARYSQADRARIVTRMLSVLKAAQMGRNLEDGPFPVEALPLETALAQYHALLEGKAQS